MGDIGKQRRRVELEPFIEQPPPEPASGPVDECGYPEPVVEPVEFGRGGVASARP